MDVLIDFESEIPIYIQLRNQIVKGIARGELVEGYSLPSVRSFADDIGINMHTVSKAYTILKSEGYIILDRRHGAFISASKKSDEDREKFKEDLSVTIYGCIAKGMTKEEINSIIQEIYNNIEEVE